MKYKQRLICCLVTASVLVSMVFVYQLRPSSFVVTFSSMDSGDSHLYGLFPKVNFLSSCKPAPSMTADYVVDDFYDKLDFTTGEEGLYVVNDTDSRYNDPKLKRILDPSEPLTVIVVPHSHNDPGWLWTLMRYYEVRTRYILSNSVKFLTENPEFRMIWSETIFLDIWWNEASEDEKEKFKTLVHDGRMEILSGGWVSVDEATTHYTAVLDQLIEGHQWLKRTLGIYSNISWSIDPFGYSTTLPYLWKKSGMTKMAILRLHGALKTYMGNRQLLTFRWRQQWDTAGKHDMPCHVEPFTLYNIEYSCGPNKQVCKLLDFARADNLPSPNKNLRHFGNPLGANSLDKIVDLIVGQYRLKASQYKHNVILMPHGDDFRYISDFEWERQYANMKLLIDYVNSKKELNVRMKFGTVGEYFKLLEKEIEKSSDMGSPESVLSGDFFTYTDRDDEYWSGYYTTRPFDKRNIRHMLELLQTTEALTSLSIAYSIQNNYPLIEIQKRLADLQSARRTHGLVQHHDAITGTSAHPTVEDFETRINEALGKLTSVLAMSVQAILMKDQMTAQPVLQPLETQIRPEHMIEKHIIAVIFPGVQLVYVNSYGRTRQEIVSVIVDSIEVEIIDDKGDAIEIQIAPVASKDDPINILSDKFEVYFELNMPPLSLAMFTIRKKRNLDSESVSQISVFKIEYGENKTPFKVTELNREEGPFTLNNDFITATFSEQDGSLLKLCNKVSGKCSDVALQWVTYRTGNSNAYCFGTIIHGVDNELNQQKSPVRITKGKLVSKIEIMHTRFTHTVLVYKTKGAQGLSLHIENVAKLSGRSDKDKELIIRLKTDIINENSRYYTDSNGFQLVNRQYRNKLPIGANFYPMTSMTVLQDASRRLTVHAGQPHGVGSLRPGELEIMIDRVPTSSGKGLEEPVVDNKPAFSKFAILLENSMPQPQKHKNKDFMEFSSATSNIVNDLIQNPVQCLFALKPFPTFKNIHFLRDDLPCDITVSNWKTFFSDEFDFTETGITLFKRTHSCAFKEQLCSGGKGVNFYSLFENLIINSISKTTLTHLHEEQHLKNENIAIDPGELESYMINW